jgi:LysR family glycine cleavage system transcriptional activator
MKTRMRTPKLNALKVFDAAARHLNFRLAAEELYVTQGAVAQAIRGLEADLEISLFKRMARGVALTEVGSKYHQEISQGLTIIDMATKNLHTDSQVITVSVPPSFASKWLVPRLPYFFEVNPGIEVRTIANEAVTDFHTQDVDAVVRQGAKPVDKGLLATLLAPTQLGIVCAASNAPEPGTLCDLESFARLPLIQDSHRHWERLFDERGIQRPNHFLQFNQTALAMDAAANGQGCAVVPRLLSFDDVASGRLIEVWSVDCETETGFWVVHPEDAPSNRKARSSFVDWMHTEAQGQHSIAIK